MEKYHNTQESRKRGQFTWKIIIHREAFDDTSMTDFEELKK
jgi:hypothetical protein